MYVLQYSSLIRHRLALIILLSLLITLDLAAQYLELSVPGHNLFVNKIAAAQHYFPALLGNDIVVSIKERQFQLQDIDLKNRVLPGAPNEKDPTAHATIIATLIGGTGTSGWQGRGGAPGCQMISTPFGQSFSADADTFYQNNRISVQNHAYGWIIENKYAADSRSFDHSVLANPALVHVFSAGNEGFKTAPDGPYTGIQGVANLTGSFKMAKNVLVVGAVDSLGRLQPYSARGPAFDGRIKPDICAYGQGGTSEAAALVSGAVATLQQAYRTVFGALPAACAVRAACITGATDMQAPGPDYESGWGSLDLYKSLQIVQEKKITTGYLAQGDTLVIPVALPENLHNAKFTFVWDDETPDAYPATTKALYSDLNMVVQTPDGKTAFPWVLHTNPQIDSLKLPAVRGVDTLNNTEQVEISFPKAGTYQIILTGRKAPGRTLFAMAWSADTVRHFLWEFPIRRTLVVPGKEVLLQWSSTIADTAARVAWKPVGSSDWIPIAAVAGAADHFLRWKIPANSTGAAQVRYCTGSTCFESDSFLISPELSVKVGYNCPEAVMLFWGGHPDAKALRYQVEGLGDRYLEYLASTSDTFVVLPRTLFPQTHFAVRPVDVQTGIEGAHSPAPAVAQQGVACYFKQFYADLVDNQFPNLFFSVGTTYRIQTVSLQRLDDGAFKVLRQWNGPLSITHFQYADVEAPPGIQRYRVVLTTLSGDVYSEILPVFVPGKDGWWVYPNPVSAGSMLQVISDVPGELELRLLTVSGGEVLQRKLEDIREQVALGNLTAGMYIWEIWRGKQRVGKGKLAVY